MKTCRVTNKEMIKFGLKIGNIKRPFRHYVCELNQPDLIVFHTKLNLFGKIVYLITFPFYIFRDGIIEAKKDFKWVMCGGIDRCIACTRKEVVEYYTNKLNRRK